MNDLMFPYTAIIHFQDCSEHYSTHSKVMNERQENYKPFNRSTSVHEMSCMYSYLSRNKLLEWSSKRMMTPSQKAKFTSSRTYLTMQASVLQ